VRERLITLACALGALLLFATLFLHGEGLERPTTRPTSVERGVNGMAGAFQWLQGEGIRTLSLRERFDSLTRRTDLPAAGNLLIVTTPVVTAFRHTEAAALERWLRAGNTLVVLAALSDRPDWALGGFTHSDLSLLTGLEFAARGATDHAERSAAAPAAAAPSSGQAEDAPRRADDSSNAMARALRATRELDKALPGFLVPNGTHPFLSGVRSAEALSDYLPQSWDVKLPHGGFVLALARERSGGAGILWVRPQGAGTVLVSAYGSLFTNRALGLADNARLLANLVTLSVVPGGAVLFDDEHQGLAAAYDPAKFYRDPRLYATLGVLGAVWLVWVLGGTRLRLPQQRTSAPREAELVRATGLFLARVLRPAAAARRMFENFFRTLRERTRSAADGAGPPWEWLAHHPRLRPADVQQLRDWYADAYSGRRVPLMRLHNLLVNTERRLTA
jgi:hypothetical protein